MAIVRISGPEALGTALRLVARVPPSPAPRQAYFTPVHDRSGAVLDEGLFLFFPAPHSFTGEDVVELQLHGSPQLASLVLREVMADQTVRMAGPGEFTRRAYLNGRIDLLRAEAVADLIAAESDAAVREAAGQLRGDSSSAIGGAQSAVRDVLTDLEGVLNFPEEAQEAEATIPAKLQRAHEQVKGLQRQAAQSRRARRLGRVTLVGPVNAGKSTLFNRLLGESRALVDEAPGTTRDVLEAPWVCDGVALTLVDTAGLRERGERPERIEALGIAQTFRALQRTDLAILVLSPESSAEELETWRARIPSEVAHVVVRGKADQLSASADGALAVSGHTGVGLDALRARVSALLTRDPSLQAQAGCSERAEEALERAAGGLAQARAALAESMLEVVAGETAMALHALEEAVGRTAEESVLDAVFRRFCIGK